MYSLLASPHKNAMIRNHYFQVKMWKQRTRYIYAQQTGNHFSEDRTCLVKKNKNLSVTKLVGRILTEPCNKMENKSSGLDPDEMKWRYHLLKWVFSNLSHNPTHLLRSKSNQTQLLWCKYIYTTTIMIWIWSKNCNYFNSTTAKCCMLYLHSAFFFQRKKMGTAMLIRNMDQCAISDIVNSLSNNPFECLFQYAMVGIFNHCSTDLWPYTCSLSIKSIIQNLYWVSSLSKPWPPDWLSRCYTTKTCI